MRELQFTITNYANNAYQYAHPIYGDDFGIVTEREQSQIFFRNKLSSALKFVADDYSWIMAQGFDALLIISIYVIDNGVTTISWHGKFCRTDCTINEVDGIITVTPETNDSYGDILNCLDTEFNLADISIRTTRARIPIPNVVQFYKMGQNAVINYWQGETWQAEVDEDKSRNDLLAISFYNSFGFCNVKLSGGIVATFTPYAFVRQYQQNVTFTLNNGTYTITIIITEGGSKSVTLKQGGTTIGTYNGTNNVGTIIDGDGNPICAVNLGIEEIYARTVTAESVGSTSRAGDFANVGSAYRYALRLDLTKGIDIAISTNFVNYVTPYGEVYSGGVPTGNYYLYPNDANYTYLPILQTYWNDDFSVWIRIERTKAADIDSTSYSALIYDTYEIGDLLDALLTANGLAVTFNKNDAYSQFLYHSPTSPVSGWAAGFRIVFAPKSNIVNPLYTAPASKIPCTLGTVLNFMRNALNVYWDLNAYGGLRLEHISFYKNGGAYGGTPTTAYDLTQMIRTRNDKPWAFGQNQYQFDKYQMPQYVKWEWMDETDKFFDGSGFRCISNYVQLGNTEEITIANVTSNINKIVMQSDQISLDGFAVIFLVDGLQTDYSYFQRDDTTQWRAANGELAMWNLQSNLLLYDAPCDKIIVSGSLRTNVDYKRTKYNEVTFPAPDVDPMQHIKTNVGDGAIESVENDLISQTLKAKLKYGNE